jgi:hypothetical protein
MVKKIIEIDYKLIAVENFLKPYPHWSIGLNSATLGTLFKTK